ncbi:MAG: hypothetical protein AAFU77_17495 [Myxococcota bacterium]
MRSVLAAACAAFLSACGASDLIYIERLVPFDGPSLRAVEETGVVTEEEVLAENNTVTNAVLDASENNSVDSFMNICVEGSDCETEFFTAHFAWVRLRNDQPPVEGSTATETVTRYTVQFTSVTGGPELPDFTTGVRAVVGAGETTTFQITLVPFEYKQVIENILSAGDPPLTYRAQVSLEGNQDLELSASTTVLIGPFNNCQDGLAISPLEAPFFCTEDE